jgi:hypothetical protein
MSLFTMNFPKFPSLTRMVGECNASIILPEGATNESGGTVSSTTYRQENLQEFTHSPASMSFFSTKGIVQLINVTRLKREVRISEFGEVEGSDAYEITNKGYNSASSVEVFVPPEASNIVAEDPFGRRMNEPKKLGTDPNRYTANLTLQVDSGESSSFTVRYHLPDSYLTPKDGNGYSFSLPLFQNEDYYFDQASITFILPEGARLTNLGSSLPNDVYSIERSAFQETITVNKQKIMALDNFTFRFTYDYNPLWSSFRPSLWAWTLSVIGCVVAAVAWKMPKKPSRVSVPAVSVKLQPEHLKAFVEAYEEKKKITLEMESLEARVQKGRIPRRRYKVRTKMLEARLNTLSRSLAEFKEKTRAAGGQYQSLMQQLEIAEAQINEAESNVKSIQSRHNRGELSLEAYRRLLADYHHRRENAETTINGILLRLREETH